MGGDLTKNFNVSSSILYWWHFYTYIYIYGFLQSWSDKDFYKDCFMNIKLVLHIVSAFTWICWGEITMGTISISEGLCDSIFLSPFVKESPMIYARADIIGGH